ncbi:MAG: cupin domain-containing protein, partial [Chitinophagaceae bacterium]
MAENTNPVTMTGPEDGPSLSIVGDTYRIIRNGQQTGNDFAVIDMLVPPGGGPGPHQHPDFEETFYMLDGEIEFKSEEGTFLAHKGDFIHIPKNGMVHCFKNKSGEDMEKLLDDLLPILDVE